VPIAEKKVPKLDERDHERGCPAERVESYTEIKPNGDRVLITRCIDCGGHNAEVTR
jgi:hypothetical protein